MTAHLPRRALIAASACACMLPRTWAQGNGGAIIVPVSAGSVADLLARRFATLLGQATAMPWVVENIAGGSGVVAARAFLRRPADARTLLWGTSGLVCNTPLLAKPPLDFNPLTDFVPVSVFAATPFVLFAATSLPADNLHDLQRLGRVQPQPVSYAGNEIGSANHLAGEALFQALGLRGLHVPYRNNQQAYLDVSEGRAQVGIYGWNNIAPLALAGKVKILALLSTAPLAADPALPTVAAQGFGKFDIQGWYGLFAAHGTPRAAVAEHEAHVERALRDRDFESYLVSTGHEVVFRSQAESAAFVEAQFQRNKGILQRLKLI